MNISALIKKSAQAGVYLFVEGEQLRFKLSVDEFPADLKTEILAHKSALIAFMSAASAEQVETRTKITKRPPQEEAVLTSFAQQRLWFIDQLQGQSAEYNMPAAIRIDGCFDVAGAEQAIVRIINRHETLRTVFKAQQGTDAQTDTVQIIQDKFDFQLKRVDLTALDEQSQQQKIALLVAQDSLKAFDLSQDLMIRATYLQCVDEGDKQQGVLVFNMHHIASDGWSMGILLKEFVAQYQSVIDGTADPLGPLAIQYADYAHWQRQWLVGDELERQLTYWTKQLEEVPEVHSLLLDHERPQIMAQQAAAAVHTHLDTSVSDKLQQIAQAHQMTPFMLLHAALALVLSRHGNNRDIVLGTPMANRMQVELEPLIGFFVNSLVLRVDTEHEFLTDYLAHVRKVNLDAQAHQDIPFEQMVQHCKVPRNTRHTPLFQIMFSMNTNEQSELSIPGVRFSPQGGGETVAKFDLDINAQIGEGGIGFSWIYDTSLFTQPHIAILSDHLVRLLTAITANPSTRLADLVMLSDQQRHHLTHQLNDTYLDYPQDQFIHQLFEDQVDKVPDNIAVVFEQHQLSYAALNQQANVWANRLIERGVKPQTMVAVLVPRCIEMTIGFLSVLKAGAAYVPMNTELPLARLKLMLTEANINVVICTSQMAQMLQSLSIELPIECLCLDVGDHLKPSQSTNVANLPDVLSQCTAQSLAYCIFTSGSTGNPKGVLVEHRSIVCHYYSWQKIYRLGDTTHCHLQMAAVGFDVSIGDMVRAFCSGGRLVLCPQDTLLDAPQLVALIDRQKIDFAEFVPAILRNLSGYLRQNNLRLRPFNYVVVGSDAWDLDDHHKTQQVLAPTSHLVNSYGLTECTVDSTCFIPDNQFSTRSKMAVIGRPLANVLIYILDDHHQLQPMGCVGELYIGGLGVARGYLNLPQMTDERFINNPFSNEADARLYKTGDLVRYLPDGNLAFIGRKDDQVKIRGFRIELAEIESALARCAGVGASLVIATGDETGQKRLIAYVVAYQDASQSTVDEAILVAQLRDTLKKSLPHYMMPSAFVVLAEFPLTINGKVNKKALPVPDGSHLQGEYLGATSETEKALVEIWAKLLKLDADTIGVSANFFELGGHSLLAIRLVAEIRNAMQQEIAIKAIFDASTIRLLAEQIDGGSNTPLRSAIIPVQRQPGEPMIASFAQQRLWFIEQLQQGRNEYNMPTALQIEGDFDVDAAEQAITRIINRHETLRTVFKAQGTDTVQIIRCESEFEFILARHDFSRLDEKQKQQKVKKLIAQDISTAFDLSQDLMIRAAYLRLSHDKGTNEDILLFNMHHIASDGWSMGVLLEEFVTQYQAVIDNQPDPLAPLAIQYADYAHWQRHWFVGDVLDRQLSYWATQLQDVPHVHSLPLDYPRPPSKALQGALLNHHFDTEQTLALQKMATKHQLTPFMLIHAALALVLSRHSSSDDIVIGTPVANRMQLELEPVIGFFINTLVLRVDTAHTNLDDYLAHIRRVNLDAQDHQDIPFEQLVEHCKVPRSTGHSPLFQIIFNMDTTQSNDLSIPSVGFKPLSGEEGGRGAVAKFDLHILATISPEGVDFSWVYDVSLFTQAHIQTLSEHLDRVLTAMVTTPQAKLADLPMLSAQETQLLLSKIEGDDVDKSLIHQQFEVQVLKTPNAVALVFEDENGTTKQLAYQQLNESANQLAHYLRAKGVLVESLVGICVDRSLEMVIAILGVLKAGGAYVPLDPDYPQARLDYIVKDTGLKHLLTQSALSQRFTIASSVALTLLDSDDFKAQGCDNPEVIDGLTCASLAYIIYTSGSTGEPKGVMIEHQNMVAFNPSFSAQLALLGVPEPSHWLWTASPSFDASLKALLVLFAGGTVVVTAQMISKDPMAVARMINKYQVGVYNSTPAMVLEVINCLEDHRPNFIVSGDEVSKAAHVAIVNYCQKYDRKIINGYGPTETTINSSYALIDKQLSIGRPQHNEIGYILNQHQQLVPFGAVGELCIGGAGLARGYLNQTQLTSECFIQNPYAQGRLYKTGDLVSYLPDGNMAFMGRLDSQVKIRGYRIELGEIQSQLSGCDNVAAALVVDAKSALGQKRLVAYVVAKDSSGLDKPLFIKDIRKQLKQNLPDYMLPAAFVVMDKMPLTANGKVDRKALPAPDGSLVQGAYVAPQSDSEIALSKVWAKQLELDVDAISITGNFFELGGHSLMMLSQINALKSEYEIIVEIKDLYENATIKYLADKADNRKMVLHDRARSVVRLSNSGENASDKAKLFMIHPFSGRMDCYADFAQRLAQDIQVYGVQAPCYYGHEFRFGSIVELAEYYADGIQSVQEHGPYHLGGWSVGGQIACYVAMMLTQRGEQIDYLALFDPTLPLSSKSTDDEARADAQVFESLVDLCIDEEANVSPLLEVIDEQKSQQTIFNDLADLLLDSQYSDFFNNKQQSLIFLKAAFDIIGAKRPPLVLELTQPMRFIMPSQRTNTDEYIEKWQTFSQCEIQTVVVEGEHSGMLSEEYLDEPVALIRQDLTTRQQFKRFKAELSYAYQNVGFYRKKLNAASINLDDIHDINDMADFPFTEKRDYRKNFPMGVIAKGFSIKSSALTRVQSSGTSGERLVTVEVGMLLLQRAVNCTAVNENVRRAFTKPGRKICRYAAPNCSDVECANPNSTMADRLLPDGTLVLPVYHDLMTTSEMLIIRAIEEIIEYQPDMYYVDPTHFAFLLRHCKRLGYNLPLAPVVTSYSAATQVSKRQIGEFFPLKTHFAELLSSSEMGWVAMTCPEGNLHFNDQSYFAEIVAQGKPATTGELCITSLDQGALPHLRYETGDAFTVMPQTCGCGDNSTVLVMEGRLKHYLSKDDEPILSPRSVDQLVGAASWLDQYQLEQTALGHFSLKLIVNDHYDEGQENYIISALRKVMGQQTIIQVDKVQYIASDRSGKFQFLIGMNNS